VVRGQSRRAGIVFAPRFHWEIAPVQKSYGVNTPWRPQPDGLKYFHDFQTQLKLPNMTTTCIPTVSPALLAVPLALIFTSRLLLTEKSSVIRDVFSSGLRTETLTRRASLVSQTLKEIRGFTHGGIND
jgi:hypothetical protein